MNLWLAYNIVLVLGLVIALAWAYDARRYAQRAFRLRDCDLPTEEIPLPATMKIGPRLEDLGPGKPLPVGSWLYMQERPPDEQYKQLR